MKLFVPDNLDDTLRLLADHPDAHILAGGTDLMVEINYGHLRPGKAISLRHVEELRHWHQHADTLTIGAGVRYSELMEPEMAALAPALAQASRSVGSPQIRNTGTIAGNLATASPAGDTLPVLSALGAIVNLRSIRGARAVPFSQFITGVKRTVLATDELIVSVSVPVARGPQEFLKIGKRNAMVIAVANLALVVDHQAKRVGCAIGSVGPTIARCTEAELLVASNMNWSNLSLPDPAIFATFGALCRQSASPIDDHRSSADYRNHAISVLAQRALRRVTWAPDPETQ